MKHLFLVSVLAIGILTGCHKNDTQKSLPHGKLLRSATEYTFLRTYEIYGYLIDWYMKVTGAKTIGVYSTADNACIIVPIDENYKNIMTNCMLYENGVTSMLTPEKGKEFISGCTDNIRGVTIPIDIINEIGCDDFYVSHVSRYSERSVIVRSACGVWTLGPVALCPNDCDFY